MRSFHSRIVWLYEHGTSTAKIAPRHALFFLYPETKNPHPSFSFLKIEIPQTTILANYSSAAVGLVDRVAHLSDADIGPRPQAGIEHVTSLSRA